jgi:hypothetical protein
LSLLHVILAMSLLVLLSCWARRRRRWWESLHARFLQYLSQLISTSWLHARMYHQLHVCYLLCMHVRPVSNSRRLGDEAKLPVSL